MADIVRIIDADTGGVVFDLDGLAPDGVTTTRVVSLDTGSAQVVTDLLPRQTPDGGAVLLSRSLPPVQMQLAVRMMAPSIDALVSSAGLLLRRLSEDRRVLERRFEGESEPRYYDLIATDLTPLLRGDPKQLFQILRRFADIEGFALNIWRQPWSRGPLLDGAANILANSTLLRDQDANGRPDGWAWDNTGGISAEQISAPAEAYEFTVATTSARNLQQTTPAGTCAPGEIWTFSVHAEATSSVARARAVVRFLDSSGAPLGTEQVGTLVTLGTTEQRLVVTTAAAPASTSRALVSIRFEDSSASPVTVRLRMAQLERASAASTWRQAPETVGNDPSTGARMPLLLLGDAPAPVRFTIAPTAGGIMRVGYARASAAGVRGRRSVASLVNAAPLRGLDGTCPQPVSVSDAGAWGGAALGEQHRRQYATANGNSTSPSASWPAATLAGSTLIAYVVVDSAGTNVTFTPPSGWTLVDSSDGSGGNQHLQTRVYKIESSAMRSGNETWTLSGARAWGIVLLEVQGGGAVTSFAKNRNDTATSSCGSGSATLAHEDAYLLFFAAAQAASVGTSPTNGFATIATSSPNVGFGVYERTVEDPNKANKSSSVIVSPAAKNVGHILVIRPGFPIPKKHRMVTLSVTDPSSLRGRWRVHARVRPTQAESWGFQLAWGLGTASESAAEITRDWTSASSTSPWVLLELGEVCLPESGTLAPLVLELWVRRTGSTVANGDIPSPPLLLDHLILAPMDLAAEIGVPEEEPEVALGSDLSTPVSSPTGRTAMTVVGTELKSDSSTDAAGMGSNEGTLYRAGLHAFTFVYYGGSSSANLATVAVRNITDGTDVVSQTVKGGASKRYVTLLATLDGTKRYQAQARSQSNAIWYLSRISRRFLAQLGSGESLATDPAGSDVRILTSAGAVGGQGRTSGPVPDVPPPGLSALWLPLYLSTPPGYVDAEHALDRTATVTVAYAPRYLT